MTELQVRLSEMHEAAEKLRRGNERLTQSMQSVLDSLNYLHIQGVESYYLTLALQTTPSELQLKRFAENLDKTADEIEAAYLQLQNATDYESSKPKVWFVGAAALMRKVTTTVEEEPEEKPEEYQLEDYIARINRPLYEELREQREQLTLQEQDIEKLLASREKLTNDLQSLKDRLISFDPRTDLAGTPRVQMLEKEIADTNAQIQTLETKITTLKQEIGGMLTRLDRVKPAPGADLSLISKLENSTTQDFVRANTFDCVKYVVNKVTIPDVIARDAHLWDNIALKHPEFGITVSDQPLTGSLLLMEPDHSYADDIAGHLMYVEKVENGNIWVTDNNHPEPVLLSDLTTELSGEHLKYLYLPWHTRA